MQREVCMPMDWRTQPLDAGSEFFAKLERKTGYASSPIDSNVKVSATSSDQQSLGLGRIRATATVNPSTGEEICQVAEADG
jgi:hypothetical protein